MKGEAEAQCSTLKSIILEPSSSSELGGKGPYVSERIKPVDIMQTSRLNAEKLTIPVLHLNPDGSRTAVQVWDKSSTPLYKNSSSEHAIGCNGKKTLSNNDLKRIKGESEAQCSTPKSIILESSSSSELGGKGAYVLETIKIADKNMESRSDALKEASKESHTDPKISKEAESAPNNMDTRIVPWKSEDNRIRNSVKVVEQDASISHTEQQLALPMKKEQNKQFSNIVAKFEDVNDSNLLVEYGLDSSSQGKLKRQHIANGKIEPKKKKKTAPDCWLAKLNDNKALVTTLVPDIGIVKPVLRPNMLDPTVAELRDLAKAMGLTGYSKLKKADLAKQLGVVLTDTDSSSQGKLKRQRIANVKTEPKKNIPKLHCLAKLHDDKALVINKEEYMVPDIDKAKPLHLPIMLNSPTLADLKDLAKIRGIKGYSRLKKADLAKELGVAIIDTGKTKAKRNEAPGVLLALT